MIYLTRSLLSRTQYSLVGSLFALSLLVMGLTFSLARPDRQSQQNQAEPRTVSPTRTGNQLSTGTTLTKGEGPQLTLARCTICDKMRLCRYLEDARWVCEMCIQTIVVTNEEATRLAQQVRQEMMNQLGIRTPTQIKFRLVLLSDLEAQEGRGTRGLFNLQEHFTVVTRTDAFGCVSVDTQTNAQSRSISISYGLTREEFIQSVSHELTHDWVFHEFPNATQADSMAAEGISELVATNLAFALGRTDWVMATEKRMNPSYKAAYEQMVRVAGHDMTRLRAYLSRMNSR